MGDTNITVLHGKILLVDDETTLRDALGSLVMDSGFEPLYASSAAEAISIVEKERDLVAIVSDLRMPGEDGLHLRSKLLVKFRDIPFIILSGFVTRELALRGVELKIAAFLEKPVKSEAFRAVILRETEARVSLLSERRAIEQTFFGEARTIVEELEPLILSLEEHPGDMDTINAIFRLVHTLKGSSGILESEVFSKFVHRFEDLLTGFKSREVEVSAGGISAMLRGNDIVKSLLSALEARAPISSTVEELVEQLRSDVQPKSDKASAKDTSGSADGKVVGGKEVKGDTIRVTSATLDEFMELSGEITVIRNMVNKLVRAIEKTQPGNKDISLLAELLDEMHKINSTLQGRIVDLRKVSVAVAMRPLKRTVRDLSNSLGKKFDLAASGEGLRVDTAISQVLTDSLIHLVRNSADHGIETPDQREASGKSPTGSIKIACKEERDEIVVTVADDGRGIDTERVKKKVVENGMMTREEVDALPQSLVLAKIFEPGFSTAATVSEVSGRGVGMDMVKSSVERVRGRIDVNTDLGVGTTFTMRLPVPKSVLIINSLLVVSGGQTFAIPQDTIVRLVQLDSDGQKSQLLRLEGGIVLRTPNGLVPLIALSSVLRIPGSFPDWNHFPSNLSVVILRGEAGLFGLVVDSILDGEEVVVKPIGQHLKGLYCFDGATFLGDGSVGLILNAPGIEKLAGFFTTSHKETGASQETSDQRVKDREYILFALGNSGCFGMPLELVYRLEEISVRQVHYSGERRVAIYRSAILPLFDLGTLLGLERDQTRDTEILSVIVFRHGERLFGLVISAVVDITATPAIVDSTIRDRVGIGGNLLIGERTVTVIDPLELLVRQGQIPSARPTLSRALNHGANAALAARMKTG